MGISSWQILLSPVLCIIVYPSYDSRQAINSNQSLYPCMVCLCCFNPIQRKILCAQTRPHLFLFLLQVLSTSQFCSLLIAILCLLSLQASSLLLNEWWLQASSYEIVINSHCINDFLRGFSCLHSSHDLLPFSDCSMKSLDLRIQSFKSDGDATNVLHARQF